MNRADGSPDLVVLGGNPGGCAAAITAARAGLSVVLLEPTRTLGGHNANGVFAFDTGDPATLGPIAREFAELTRQHYRDTGAHDPVLAQRRDPVWESAVAATVWARLCDRTPNLSVVLEAVPVAAERVGRRVVSVTWEAADTPAGDLLAEPGSKARQRLTPRLVVDASYEGDLLEWAGIPHRLGREPRSAAEPHAGRIYTSDRQLGPDGILPHSVLPGSTGEGDDRVMAFAARLHCRWYDDPSPDAAHRIRTPSATYDPKRYRWAPRAWTDDGAPVWFTGIELLVGDKVLLSRTVAGNDVAAPATDYIRAHPRERYRFRRAIVEHALDFLYYVQTDGGCPTLGLAYDEFTDHDNIPYRIYAREGRRLSGVVTLTEADLSPFLHGDGVRPPAQPHSVAVGDWAIESRATADVVEPGYPWPEGWFFDRFSRAPHQIPYECLISPEIDNVAFCGPVSASHLAFSAIRVEATRMNLGAAAGLAAVQAADPQRDGYFTGVDLDTLQHHLIGSGAALTFFVDVPPEHPGFAAIQWAALRGWIPADEHWQFAPSQPVSWEEFAIVTVMLLDVPRSVTGAHFAGVGGRHRAFVALESLYDLGTRAGRPLFELPPAAPSAVADLLAPAPATPQIALDTAAPVTAAVAEPLLTKAARALGRPETVTCAALDALHELACAPDHVLRRGDLAQVLHRFSP